MKFCLRILLSILVVNGMSVGSTNRQVYPGLTLFSPMPLVSGALDVTIYLLDDAHLFVHTWDVELTSSMNPYLLPDSSILYPFRVPNPTMDGGGAGGGIKRIAWNNDVLWEYYVSNDSLQAHHDIEPLPNGNILVITWERKTAAEAYAMGRQTIGNLLQEMWVEAILELQPIGPDQANVVWEWHLWDHLVQNEDPALPGYGEISNHPELMNINYGVVGSFHSPPNADWGHFNCIDYNAELDQILITSRLFHEIYIIDHSTTCSEAASHSGGNSGRGGDFLYRWGNPHAYSRGMPSDRQLFIPHGGVWADTGYPGAGNLLIFNNGFEQNNSAVFEITPPINEYGNYIMDGIEPFGPGSPQWIYSNSFFSDIQSGVFRLPNGNTLITSARDNLILEVSPDDEVVWEYIFENPEYTIPRALKYPMDYLSNDHSGDVNGDNQIDILDIVELVIFILNGEPWPPGADLNGDDIIDILDIVNLVEMILGDV